MSEPDLDARLLRFDRNTVVQASAGTGKTETLTTLYVCCLGGATLLPEGGDGRVPPERILAITFTEKAAGEMAQRIRGAVSHLARAPDPEAVRAAPESEHPLVVRRFAAQVARKQAAASGYRPPTPSEWSAIGRRLTDATIATFHGFAGGLLRRHPMEAGVDPGYALLDQTEAEARADATARAAVRAALEADAPGVRALVAAWGYRRTAAEVARTLAWLGERGEPPEALLAHSHLSSEAWAPETIGAIPAEVLAAVEPVVALTDPAFTGNTLDALAAARRAVDALRSAGGDVEAIVRAIGAADEALRPIRQSRGGLGEAKAAARAVLTDARDRARAAQLWPRAAHLARGLAHLVERAAEAYGAEKAATDTLDFHDLLVRARDLLRDHPGVRRAVRDRYDVVLVDELQDTDPVQADLVERLRADDDGEALLPAGLFIVGDRKQSIYGFRGADVGVFQALARRIVGAGGERLSLSTSYRADASLLDAVNPLAALALGAASPYASGYDVADDDLHPASPGGDGDGAPRVELLDGAGRSAPPPPEREARMVARRIAALCAEGLEPGRVAVLLPTFTHLMVWTEELLRAGLAFHVVKGKGYFDAPEVRDVARALSLLVDPGNPVAIAAVLRSPMVGLSDPSLARLFAEGPPFGRWLDRDAALPEGIGTDEAARLHGFARLLTELSHHGDRVGPASSLEALLRGTGYAAVCAALPGGEQKVANLDKLLALARAREASGKGDLKAFARELAASIEGARASAEQHAAVVEESAGDAVRVLTVHQAKGLEFDVVAVGGLCRGRRADTSPLRLDPELGACLKVDGEAGRLEPAGLFGEADARAKAREDAERARLFYVALTRAKHRLLLAGESAKAPPKGSERSLVEAAIAAGAPVDRVPFDALPAPPLHEDPEARVDALDAARAAALARAVAPLSRLPVERIFLPVTALSTFAECPRRYRAAFLLGLAEHPGPRVPLDDEPGEAASSGGADPRRRGSLTHALLERVDLTAFETDGRAHLEAVAPLVGLDPAGDARLVDAAERFLSSGYGRALAALPGEAVARELPFVLAARGGALTVHVKGQIDLLVLRDGVAEVVDYKLTRPRGDGVEDYRFQLECYGAAAAEGLGAPAVRLGIQFLEGPASGPRWLDDPAPPAAVEGRVVELGRGILEARERGRYQGHPIETCRRLRCGYLGLCHGEAADAPPDDDAAPAAPD